jgi:hypothetical protein
MSERLINGLSKVTPLGSTSEKFLRGETVEKIIARFKLRNTLVFSGPYSPVLRRPTRN